MIDWEEVMKVVIVLPIYIAFLGIFMIMFDEVLFNKEVLLIILCSWMCLVIGYYWRKRVGLKKQLTNSEGEE